VSAFRLIDLKGRLLGGSAMQDARGIQERLLRLAWQDAFEEEP
jgi:hypothetical protein